MAWDLHLHAELGIAYEPLEVLDRGPDPHHSGLRDVGITIAYQVPGHVDTHLLTLDRSVTPEKLAELQEGL